MTLADGLPHFSSGDGWASWTTGLEARGRKIVSLIEHFRDQPDEHGLQFAHAFLVDIEKWKSMCLKERMGNAGLNSPASVWAAFWGAVTGSTDLQKIEAVMSLKGFGSSTDADTGMRRAKVASSVLRFLNPAEWGVVDWRTLAIRSALTKCNGDIDLALKEAGRSRAQDMRKLFDIVDGQVVCGEVKAYRQMRAESPLSRAADIDMALFGLSLTVWPLPNKET